MIEWAPGRQVLYHRPGHGNFHLLDPTTGDERPLIPDDSVGFLFYPRYGPDGQQVVAVWNRTAPHAVGPRGHGLWRFPVEETADDPLLLLGVEAGTRVPIGWSADGAWAYILNHESEPPRVERIAIRGGEPETVATLPWTNAELRPFFAESGCSTVDGRGFVCAVYESQSDVWLAEGFDPEVQ